MSPSAGGARSHWRHPGSTTPRGSAIREDGGRFKLEDIFAGDPACSEVHEFACAVCHTFLDDPVQLPCTHIFCESCVAPCEACPTCREELAGGPARGRPLRECNKPMHRLMNRVRVRCPYHRGGGGEDVAGLDAERVVPRAASLPASSGGGCASPEAAEGPERKRRRGDSGGDGAASADAEAVAGTFCPWAVEYGDLLAHHLRVCEFHVVECPRGCGESMQRRELEAHKDSCEMDPQKCHICGERMKSHMMAEHSRQAAEMHVRILEDKVVMRMDTKDMMATVIKRIIRLEEKATSKAELRTAQQAAQEGDFERRNTMVWEVPIRELLATKRMKVTSSQTALVDGVEAFFNFFPSRDCLDPERNRYVSLYVTCGLRADAVLAMTTVNGQQLVQRRMANVDFSYGSGFTEFCPVDTIKQKERLLIHFAVQKVHAKTVS